MLLLAGALYLAAISATGLLLFALPGGGQAGLVKSGIGTLLALTAFLLFPPGSLPPLVNIPCGGIACFLLLAAALGTNTAGGEEKDKGRWNALLLLFAASSAFCLVYYYRGAPGSFFNLGSFTALPFWKIAHGADLVGFVLLAVACIAGLRSFTASVASNRTITFTAMALCALWVCLFLPFNFAPVTNWPPRIVATVDAILFWGKFLSVYFLAQRLPMLPAWALWPPVAIGAGLLGLSFWV